jgi:hypothetical protein
MSLTIKDFGMPAVFLGALVLSMLFCASLPYHVKSVLCSLSTGMKECLVFSLLFVILDLVCASIMRLGHKAMKYSLVIIPMVCCSNFVNTMGWYIISMQTAGYCGHASTVRQVAGPLVESPSVLRLIGRDGHVPCYGKVHRRIFQDPHQDDAGFYRRDRIERRSAPSFSSLTDGRFVGHEIKLITAIAKAVTVNDFMYERFSQQ